MKIRTEINDVETKKSVDERNRSMFFKRINKTDKPLARLIKDKISGT